MSSLQTQKTSPTREGQLENENLFLKKEVVRLNQSLRMQAATLIVESLSSPKALLSFPRRLFKFVERYQKTKLWRDTILTLECGLPLDVLREATIPELSISELKALKKLAINPNTSDEYFASHPDQPTLKIVEERITQFQEILSSGLNFKPETSPSPKQNREKSCDVLMVLHTTLPDQINGYTRRSEEILKTLRSPSNISTTDLECWNVLGTARPSVTRQLGYPQQTIGYLNETDTPYTPLEMPTTQCDQLREYLRDYSQAITQKIEQTSPQIIHAASNHITGMSAAIAAQKAGIPFVYEIRGLWEETRISIEPSYQHSMGYKVQRYLEIETAKLADTVCVNGTAIMELLIEHKIPADKIILLSNGCDPEAFHVDETCVNSLREAWNLKNIPTIGFVGSITPYEGIADLFEACARLKDLSFQILMIGDGSETETLKQVAHSLGINQRIIWTGNISPQIAIQAYNLIDIAPIIRKDTPVTRLVPPLKPLEIMAGRAVLIVSDLKPLIEFAENGRGKIVRSNDVSMLESTLRELLSSNESRMRLTSHAFEWVNDNRKWSNIRTILDKVYRNLGARPSIK